MSATHRDAKKAVFSCAMKLDPRLHWMDCAALSCRAVDRLEAPRICCDSDPLQLSQSRAHNTL